jgi:hypothetical protein
MCEPQGLNAHDLDVVNPTRRYTVRDSRPLTNGLQDFPEYGIKPGLPCRPVLIAWGNEASRALPSGLNLDLDVPRFTPISRLICC